MNVADEERGEEYDVVIIGTGMGGGILGRKLSELGRRVLFLERGHRIGGSTSTAAIAADSARERIGAGLWPEQFNIDIDGVESRIHPALGCGVGGSTLLYAAALERLERHDVETSPDCEHPTGGWPISYDELSRYYDVAETMLNVRGTNDPRLPDWPVLKRPPAMRGADAVLMGDLARSGLQPYRLHVGISYKLNCGECLGSVCGSACKSDSKTCGIDIAERNGARLLTGCDVTNLVADETSVSAVEYVQDGRKKLARGKIVVLAAGALGSPAILLKSTSPAWPNGVANGSGLVGRNLMFHADDWLAIWPSAKESLAGPAKTISSRYFYLKDRTRLGMLQSTGLSASYGNILVFLYQWFDTSWYRHLRFVRPFLRIPAKLAEKLFGSATILALMIEDIPYPENRVELDDASPSGVRIVYRFRDELIDRARKARELVNTHLSLNRKYWIRPKFDLNWGHPMGTCRFGDDASESVLNVDCRSHEVDNLYVVDSSFMPTGGGVNPSLTIAANALRVADSIDAQLAANADRHDARPAVAS